MAKESFEEEFDKSEDVFSGILSRYLPYWPLFIALIICMVIAGVLYLRYATPIYETSAKILVKDEKKGIDESKIMESLDLFGSKKIVENEIEVIRSVELMSQIVNDLHLYSPVYTSGTFKDASAYTASPVIVEMKHPDSIQVLQKKKLIKKKEKIYFTYDFKETKIKFKDQEACLNTWVNTPFGTLRFLPNPNYEEPEEERSLYFRLRSPYEVANDLLEKVEVEPASKMASIIHLRMQDAETKRAENIINRLIVAYNMAGVADKNSLGANTLSFVTQRLNRVVKELGAVENKIQKFKSRNQIIDISEQGRIFLESAEKNNELITQNSVQQAVLDEVDGYVSGKGGQNISISALGITDPVLNELLALLHTSELKYEGLKSSTAQNNPVALAVAGEIEMTKAKIRDNIRTQRKNLASGSNAVTNVQQRYASVLNTIPRQERELLQISREQSIKNSIYAFLLQKKEETELSLAATVADSRLIDRAHSTIKPVSPKAPIVLGIAVVFALVAGIIFVSIKEVFNRNILFRAEIEKMSNVPIVGEISSSASKSSIVISEGQRNYIAEQFRQLRTSLSFLGIGRQSKKILITSTISGEGKSFVSGNLGISIALGDKKVVLLELDLRKPRLSDMFNISRHQGITNYLIGKTTEERIIKQTQVHPNLFIIPSGPIPPNPSELIMSKKMGTLIAFLEENFDYVIIDTAPTSPVTDAFILSPLCDATLYVVRHGVTPKTAIKNFDNSNRVRPLNNVAFIFNGVEMRGFGNEYGYGYGNSYGQEYNDDKVVVKKKASKIL